MRKRMYDLAMHIALSSLTRGHRVLHRVSGGRLGRRFPGGQQVIWITSLGRRSGEWRRTPLLAVRDDGADPAVYVVAGSNAGQAKVPSWVFNVREHGEGYVEVDGKRWRVHFEEATGELRDVLYSRLTSSWRFFAGYEVRAERYIPVFRVVLEERVSDSPATPPRPS